MTLPQARGPGIGLRTLWQSFRDPAGKSQLPDFLRDTCIRRVLFIALTDAWHLDQPQTVQNRYCCLT